MIWRLGIMLGTINAIYFSSNAFLPDYLRSNGQGEWISAALTGLNAGQVPASFLLLAVAGRLERKAWPYVVCGLLCLMATGGIVFGTGRLDRGRRRACRALPPPRCSFWFWRCRLC